MATNKRKWLTESSDDTGNFEEKRRKSCLDRPSQSFSKDQNMRDGSIKQLILNNFMCYSNLHIDFNSHINIVIDQNRKSKNAIMNALAIGLGGKGKYIFRESSEKDLIKMKDKNAIITITLSNEASSAYLSQVFGNEIIIKRTIQPDPKKNNFKIQSKAGTFNSVDDVKKMCLKFNIQIGNLICLFDQDILNNFNTTDATDASNLFMSAVVSQKTSKISKKCLDIKGAIKDQSSENEVKNIKKLDNENRKHEDSASKGECSRHVENNLQKNDKLVREIIDEILDVEKQLKEKELDIDNTNKALCNLEKDVQNLQIEKENRNIVTNTIQQLMKEKEEKHKKLNLIIEEVIELKSKNSNFENIKQEIAEKCLLNNLSKLEQEEAQHLKNITSIKENVQKCLTRSLKMCQDDQLQILSQMDLIRDQKTRNVSTFQQVKESLDRWLQILNIESNFEEGHRKMENILEEVDEITRKIDREKSKLDQIDTKEKELEECIENLKKKLQEYENKRKFLIARHNELYKKFNSLVDESIQETRQKDNFRSNQEIIRKITVEFFKSRISNPVPEERLSSEDISKLMDLNLAEYMSHSETINNWKETLQSSFENVLQTFQDLKVTIEMNEEEETLKIIPLRGFGEATSMSNLSGAEKDFVNLAFLCSLWHIKELPFYVVDLDIFIKDDVNHSKIKKLIINYAKSHLDQQFIFLTSRENVPFESDEFVKIHRLPGAAN